MANLYPLLISALIGVLPVLTLLAVLQFLDSFKLVRIRVILGMIFAGGVSGLIAYFANGLVLASGTIEFVSYSRYVAPVLEELLKASVLLYLLKTHRVGFLVDAAIMGFSAGAGFALVENAYYLFHSDLNLGIWLVRGFGTAVMHGGVTAIFAIVTMAGMEKHEKLTPLTCLPGLAIAALIHSAFNHFFFSPLLSSMVVFMVLPPFMIWVFGKSSASLNDWLELDFDADTDLMEQLDSNDFHATHAGQYLKALSERFDEAVITDMRRFLRIYTELSIRAKGTMLMRQHGMEPPFDPAIPASFEEMRELESRIGKTAMLAISPFLKIDRRDLWHLNALETDSSKE